DFHRPGAARPRGRARRPGAVVLVAGHPAGGRRAGGRRLAVLRPVPGGPAGRLRPRRHGPGDLRVPVRRLRAGGAPRAGPGPMVTPDGAGAPRPARAPALRPGHPGRARAVRAVRVPAAGPAGGVPGEVLPRHLRGGGRAGLTSPAAVSARKERTAMKAVRIGLVGDYDPGVTAHRAIPEALALAGKHLGRALEVPWLPTAALAPAAPAPLAHS